MSKIEWTNETWNVTTGCTRASAGCDNCYAVAMTKRLANMEATEEKYGGLVNEGKNHFNGKIKLHEDELEKPLRWRKPRKVFVNSMSDLFHPDVPFDFVDKVFSVMALTPQHTYQVLTKRPERMAEYFKTRQNDVLSYGWISVDDNKKIVPLPNLWVGTSVENQEAADERIPHLLKCPAAVRFLSCEPLLGEVNIQRKLSSIPNGFPLHNGSNGPVYPEGTTWSEKIDWVIVGGESGHNARPMHPDWVRSLRDQCEDAGVPFFFKQWGAYKPNHGHNNRYAHKWDDGNYAHKVGKKNAGRLMDGKEYNEFPTSKEAELE